MRCVSMAFTIRKSQKIRCIKYIDECKAAAIAACDDPEDVVEIYNLETPEVKYTLELVTQEKVEEGAGNETGEGVKPSIDKTPENQVNPA